MSELYNKMTTADAVTENSGVTNSTSGDKCVNLFFDMGGLRRDPDQCLNEFKEAYYENKDYAARLLLLMRDREGVGERNLFRVCLTWLINKDKRLARKIVSKIPELGRWDDLTVVFKTKLQGLAVDMIRKALFEDKNELCAKWMPRRGHVFNTLFREFEMSPKELRMHLKSLNTTVEKQLCEQQYDQIDFERVPSKASARYQNTFGRHAPEKYAEYIDALKSGDAKINASSIYPYEILVSALNGNKDVANEQWKSQPNYMNDDFSVLPVIDVSGSMTCYNITPSCDVLKGAVSLGMYISERSTVFKDEFITFSGDAKFHKILNTDINEKYNEIINSTQNCSTNLKLVFDVLLQRAVENNLPQESMPDCMLILSDMEFDSVQYDADMYFYNRTNKTLDTVFESIKAEYSKYGYTVPMLVFWNLDSRSGNNYPVKYDEHGTALVSGFSPQIMKTIMGGVSSPKQIMLDAIMVERYNY